MCWDGRKLLLVQYPPEIASLKNFHIHCDLKLPKYYKKYFSHAVIREDEFFLGSNSVSRVCQFYINGTNKDLVVGGAMRRQSVNQRNKSLQQPIC